MLPALVLRTLRSADPKCLWKFAWNFGVKGMLSVEKFKRRIKRGEYFPRVSAYFDHQQLQFALPGLLGGRRGEGRHRSGGVAPHH